MGQRLYRLSSLADRSGVYTDNKKASPEPACKIGLYVISG